MNKKKILATLVMLSLLQGSVYAEITTEAYNDFFDNGRAHSYFQIKDGKVIKDALAGENDTVVDENNKVTIDIYSQIKRDENNDRGTVFDLSHENYIGKDLTINFHEDVVFDGGDNNTGVGQTSFKVGTYNYKNENVSINLDDGKSLYIKGSTTSYGGEEPFLINNSNTVTINNGNLIIETIYPNKPSDNGKGMFIDGKSQLTVNNDSVRIYRSLNRGSDLWEKWEDYGLAVNDSIVDFTTKDFYIGSSDTKKFETFEYGLMLQHSAEATIKEAINIDINASKSAVYGSGSSYISLSANNIDVTGGNNGINLNGQSSAEISGDKISINSNGNAIRVENSDLN